MSPPTTSKDSRFKRPANRGRRTIPRVPRNQLTSAQRATLHTLISQGIPMMEARAQRRRIQNEGGLGPNISPTSTTVHNPAQHAESRAGIGNEQQIDSRARAPAQTSRIGLNLQT